MEMNECINHQTRTKPKFLDRVKILFGGTIVVDSVIWVDRHVETRGSQAQDTIEFKR